MRFIVDEGVDAAIVTAINSDGHDVRWMAEEMEGSTDDVVLRLERDRLERRIQRQELNRKVPPAVGRAACGDWKFAPVPSFPVQRRRIRLPDARNATPMDTFDAINQRRSVKAFDPTHRLTAAEETRLLEAAIQSPTSFNMQNWRFVVVRDPALRQQIRAAAVDQAQVTDASLLIVLTADLAAWRKSPERYWRNAAPDVQKLVTGWMGPFYEGKEQLQRDEAMRSCGIAGQTIMLAAKAMGYDSCPMIGFDQGKVAELVNLPGDHVIGFMIAVGKAVKPAMPKGGQLALSDVVVQDRFA